MNHFLLSFHFIFSIVFLVSVMKMGQAAMTREQMDGLLNAIFDYITHENIENTQLTTVRQQVGQWPALHGNERDILTTKCTGLAENTETTRIVVACFYLRYYQNPVQSSISPQEALSAAVKTITKQDQLHSIIYTPLKECKEAAFINTLELIRSLVAAGVPWGTDYTVQNGQCTALTYAQLHDQLHKSQRRVYQQECNIVRQNPNNRPVWLVLACDVLSKYYWRIFG